MLSPEIWQKILLASPAILAFLEVLRRTGKGVRFVWRMMRKFGELADQLLGDEKHPSLMQLLQDVQARQSRIEQAQVEHLEQWHGAATAPAVPIRRDGRDGRDTARRR